MEVEYKIDEKLGSFNNDQQELNFHVEIRQTKLANLSISSRDGSNGFE